MGRRFLPLALIIVGALAVFLGRAALAGLIWMPRTFEIFDSLTVVGGLILVVYDHTRLRRTDWFTAGVIGVLVGAGMWVASLFTPYPFLGRLNGKAEQALLREFSVLNWGGDLKKDQQLLSAHPAGEHHRVGQHAQRNPVDEHG